MTERRTEHAPKLAALRAEAAGLLSGDGRARLLKHVEACEVCAEHLRGARRFQAIVSRATGEPAVDESGAVQRVMVRNRLAQRRSRVQWGGIAVAAGVLLAVVLALQHNAEQRAALTKAPQAPAEKKPAVEPAPSELLAVTVTALRGQVQLIEPASPERLLSIDEAIHEHSVLQPAEHASVDLALGEVSSVHVGANSEVALDAIRSDRVALRLMRGEISNAVAKRAAGQSYEVLAAGHRVAVHGTLFAVRTGGPTGLAVRCDEGVVEIIAPDGKSVLLKAPASWNERIGAADAPVPPPLEITKPYAVQAGAVLSLPALSGIEGWELGGQVYASDSGLKMRVPPGALELTALLGGGRREAVRVEVDAVGGQVTPKDLQFLKAPDEPTAPPTPETDIDASKVILEGKPALQRCYERSLKNESSGSQALRLSISIDPRGKVRKVEPAAQGEGAALPPELAQCIRTTVLGWHFPAPGGDGLTLEAPLRFQLRR